MEFDATGFSAPKPVVRPGVMPRDLRAVATVFERSFERTTFDAGLEAEQESCASRFRYPLGSVG